MSTKKVSLRMVVVFSFAVMVFGITAQAPAETIYLDDFSGGSGTNLSGTAPDIDNWTGAGSDTWAASTTEAAWTRM